LRTGRSNILGVIVRDTEDPFFAIIIKSIIRTARKHDLDVMLTSFENKLEHMHTPKQVFRSGLCDGVIVIGHLTGDESIIMDIARTNRHIVGITRLSAHDPFPCIEFNNEIAAKSAMQYLRSLGHTKIGFLGTDTIPAIKQRKQIYLDIMKRDGLPVPPEYVQVGSNFQANNGYVLMNKILAYPDRPTVILAGNDLMAIGALHAAAENGLSVPDDISVMGFDNIQYAGFVCPPLTTVSFPAVEMGERAVNVIMNLIENGQTDAEIVATLLEPKLIIRKSTKSPRE